MRDEYPYTKHLTHLTTQVEELFGLDETDLQIIRVLIDKWAHGRPVRVTDITIHWSKHIAAPASIHWRLNKDMVDQRLVQLIPCTEDARVKLVVPGPRMAELESYLKNTWVFPRGRKEKSPRTQVQLELPLEDN